MQAKVPAASRHLGLGAVKGPLFHKMQPSKRDEKH
jgi:hypothetical protein